MGESTHNTEQKKVLTPNGHFIITVSELFAGWFCHKHRPAYRKREQLLKETL